MLGGAGFQKKLFGVSASEQSRCALWAKKAQKKFAKSLWVK